MAAPIFRYFALWCVVAVCVWALCEASVINDVNNMLRDNVAAKVNNVKGVMLRNDEATATATATVVAYADEKSDDDNGDGDEESSVELLRFVNDNDGNSVDATTMNNDAIRTTMHQQQQQQDASATDSLSMSDQVRLLAKQMNALMTRRREDYELLERNLRNTLTASMAAAAEPHGTDAAASSPSLRNELEALRREVKFLQNGHFNDNKERLTIEWLQQSVSELRKQIAELQQIAGDAVRDINRGSQTYEDLETIRNDYQQLKLEVVALRERQQQNDVYVRELREELMQQEDQMHHEQNKMNGKQQQQGQQGNADTDLLADHKRRHCRFQQEQIHHLQVAQRSLKRQLSELKYHRISDRVRSIEIEQHRMADANFNLSRQIASLDKLHSSMFELLEDVEGLQTRMDKTEPDLRHELSKLEFVNAQLTSEQNLLREEGKNVARSLQAMAVSVSTLQDERTGIKQTQANVSRLSSNVDRLQSMMDDVQRALVHRRRSDEKKHQHHHRRSHDGESTKHSQTNQQQEATPEAATTETSSNAAELLVAKLENVEEQYESIVRNLPEDCAAAVSSTEPHDGIYMIAPAGQSRPQMAHCSAEGWTTVQRRFDGSANFNRSWEDYASGFGSPSGEYWIGNEQLHHLTRNNCTALRIVMQDIYDNVWVAEYGHFYISSRSDGYRLDVGGYSGNASNALDYQQGMQFSAIDVDRDISQTHCAANYEGGWWFSHCQHANLNGRYNLGLTWFDAARNEWIAVKSSEMLLKRQACPYAAAGDADATSEATPAPKSVTTATMASTSTMRQVTPTAAAT